MAPFTVSNLAAYSTQVLCLALVPLVLLSVFRVNAAGTRYALLRLTLALCLLLPWIQPRLAPGADASTAAIVAGPASENVWPVAATGRSVDWAWWIQVVVIGGAAARLLWLGIGLARLRTLRRSGHPANPADHVPLQQALRTNADVRYVAACSQPVTFGFSSPVVLLPASLESHAPEIREAVLAHELIHVQRRDWAWVLAEEAVRAVFWFHPAMCWLVSRVQLAREEVVDCLAVARTGRRRAYVEALLAFADRAPVTAAPAFVRRRHLFRRVVLISSEDVMTAKRLLFSTASILALLTVGGIYVVDRFPLVAAPAEQILQKTPGPLESAANPITPENPIPRRVEHKSPQYPPEAAAENAWVSVTLRLTIDQTGSVAEARVTASRLRLGDGVTDLNDERAKRVYDAVVSAAANAAAAWRFDAPVSAPISIDTTFFFAPQLPVSDTPAAAPNQTVRMADDGALRVGGNIKPPTKVKDVRPVYPPDAKAAGIQGVVIFEIRIDEQGRVSDAKVLRSVAGLDEAALDAVRQWEFTPTQLNGAPVPVILVVTVQFTLA